MNLLFALSSDADSGKIKDTQFGDYYSAISANTDWAILKPYVKTATKTYILPYLGKAFYNAILAATDEILLEVQDELKSAVAYFTIFDALPFLNLDISGSGVYQNVNKNASNSPLWAMDKARWNAIVNGDKALDRALNLFVDNIDHASLESYKVSKSYKKSSTDFFKGKDEFAEHIQVDNFKSYLAMIPDIRKAEMDLYDQICGDQLTESLASSNEKDKKLIYLCQAALVQKTMAMAIPHLTVYMDKDGLMVMSSIDGMENSRIGVFSKNNEIAIQKLINRVEQDYLTAMKRIYDYLYKNADHFTTWKEGLPDSQRNSKIITLNNCEGSIMM